MVKQLAVTVSSRISTPIFLEVSISASMMTSGSRNSGMPYFSTPAGHVQRFEDGHLDAIPANSPAQARPAGPETVMAAFFWAAAPAAGTSSMPRPMAQSG